jgi:hypothetical protein
MKKPYHIVFTTIYYPLVLNDLLSNISKFGHLDNTKVWVIGDHKTPASAAVLASEVSAKGLEAEYLDIQAQDKWGKGIEFYGRIPYNSEARRLIGYLKALEEGCELLISIDDDNFPTEDDFIGGHAKTGQTTTGDMISEQSGFHNICEYLEFMPNRQIFPRGFPFKLRGEPNRAKLVAPPTKAKIGVTEGLWLLEPDVDATTWLNGKISAGAYKGPDSFVLDQKTWSPVNTQNVSVVRELIPAYFCVPMAWPVPGGQIARYGDIWGGYFLQALLQGTDYHIAFGRPLTEHRRNPHVYIDDLRFEFWGMILTDWLLETLRQNFKAKEKAIPERVKELAIFLTEQANTNMPKWSPPEMKAFLIHTAENLSLWSEACVQMGL